MRFQELNEQERIQYIKDGFILILEQLAKDPSKLKNYIKLPDKPKTVKPVIEKLADDMNDEQKTTIDERNKLATEKAAVENTRLEAEYKEAEEHLKKVEAIVTKMEKKE